MDVLLELSDALTHRACDLRDAFSSKQKHDNYQDHQDMGKAQVFKHDCLTSKERDELSDGLLFFRAFGTRSSPRRCLAHTNHTEGSRERRANMDRRRE